MEAKAGPRCVVEESGGEGGPDACLESKASHYASYYESFLVWQSLIHSSLSSINLFSAHSDFKLDSVFICTAGDLYFSKVRS